MLKNIILKEINFIKNVKYDRNNYNRNCYNFTLFFHLFIYYARFDRV